MKKQQITFSFGTGHLSRWLQKSAMPFCFIFFPCFLLTGCFNTGAPTFMLLDSYFPLWMLCAVLGIVAAIIARAIFVYLGLDELLPFRLLIYVCLALIVTCLLYLLLSTR